MQREVYRYRQIDSTNSQASRLFSEGRNTGDAFVVADIQTNGRGQSDHVWISEKGKNLLMSWIIEPAFLSVASQFLLSKAVSLALTDLIGSFALPSRIKWPNDILCGTRKIAGILIENRIVGNRLRGSIVGIGLNVNQERFPDFPFEATSMCREAGRSYAIREIETHLMDRLEQRYRQLKEKFYDLISAQYNERMFRLNERSDFQDGASTISGIARGVDEKGELLIETSGGIKSYGFHEIRMIP